MSGNLLALPLTFSKHVDHIPLVHGNTRLYILIHLKFHHRVYKYYITNLSITNFLVHSGYISVITIISLIGQDSLSEGNNICLLHCRNALTAWYHHIQISFYPKQRETHPSVNTVC